MRELAVAQLVHDLARFGVAVVVPLLGLPAAQHVERAACELRVDQHVLQRHHQAVATEWRHEPRQAGGGDEHHVVGAGDRQAQCRHVVDRLVIGAIELLVAGADLQHSLLPFGARGGVMRAVVRCTEVPVAVEQVVEQAAMPGDAGCQMHLEAEPTVSVGSLLIGLARSDLHAAHEILVAVDGA